MSPLNSYLLASECCSVLSGWRVATRCSASSRWRRARSTAAQSCWRSGELGIESDW